jgi:DsbC/DsbD-like thiol-disulfide interchange protein
LPIDTRIPGSAARAGLACLALAAGGLVAARPAAAVASPWIVNPQSQVRLIGGDLVAPRHGELRLGVHFRLAPGWHAYWKNSGDAGFAPVVTWKDVPGLAPPELLWPAPHRFELPGGLEAFGYSDEVVYPVRATIATMPTGATPPAPGGPGAPGGRSGSLGVLRLVANVDYLVCKVDCVPHRYDLALDQPLGERAEADPRTAPLLDRWWREVPLAAGSAPRPAGAPAGAASASPPDMTLAATAAPGELRLALRLRGVTAAPRGADLFFEAHPALELGCPRVRATDGGLLFEVPARRKDASTPLPAATAIAWTATGLMQVGAPTPLAIAARQDVAVPAANAAASAAMPSAGVGEPSGPAGNASVQTANASAPAAKASAPGVNAPAPDSKEAAPPAIGASAVRPEATGRPEPRGRLRLEPRGRLRGFLAARDPRIVSLAAVAAALLTLEGWGLLRRRPAAARPPDSWPCSRPWACSTRCRSRSARKDSPASSSPCSP